MGEPIILIKFEGRDADQHIVDMRLLGRALQGFDRIISAGIIVLSEKRPPRKKERAPLRVKAFPPTEGSQEIQAVLQDMPGLLALGWQLYSSTDGEIIWHWVSLVLSFFGGRKNEAEGHLQAMLDLNKHHLESRDRATEAQLASRDKENQEWRDLIMRVVQHLAPAALDAVAPVGPSVRNVGVKIGGTAMTGVDEAMADSIRAKGELDLGDLKPMTLVTDGFAHHNRTLKVERPDEPGRYMTAVVKDPAFDEFPNAYTRAASERAAITVMAKLAYRNGQLEKIYIMDLMRDGS